MLVNLSQYRGLVGTFNNRNYYHKSTLSLGRSCQNTFFLNCAFTFCNISCLFALLVTVFLTLKSNSYRSTIYFHTLSFLVTIITIWSLLWLYSLLILSKLLSTIFYQMFIFHQIIALQNYEKWFSFHLKSSFRSRDIQIFVFLSFLFFSLSVISSEVDPRKMLKFMTSTTCHQRI